MVNIFSEMEGRLVDFENLDGRRVFYLSAQDSDEICFDFYGGRINPDVKPGENVRVKYLPSLLSMIFNEGIKYMRALSVEKIQEAKTL